jgi:hypothetical protein
LTTAAGCCCCCCSTGRAYDPPAPPTAPAPEARDKDPRRPPPGLVAEADACIAVGTPCALSEAREAVLHNCCKVGGSRATCAANPLSPSTCGTAPRTCGRKETWLEIEKIGEKEEQRTLHEAETTSWSRSRRRPTAADNSENTSSGAPNRQTCDPAKNSNASTRIRG